MTDKTEADWLKEIERLEAQLREAKDSLAEAQDNAAKAILNDDLKGTESEAIRVARDWITAVEAALVKARKNLEGVREAKAAETRGAALRRARDAAKARHDAVKAMEKALYQAERAFGDFVISGLEYRKHMLAADMKPPSLEKMAAPEVFRGTIHLVAPKISNVAQVPRAVKAAQVLLSDWVSKQTPWKG